MIVFMKTIMRTVLAGIFVAAVSLTASAQPYQIDWFTIAGGGGTSTGGVYSVSGTIGQSDAGTMSGGNFTLQGGFWSVVGVVQTPNAPYLHLTRSGNTVILSWPSSGTTFNLQSTAALNPSAWGSVLPLPSVTGGTNYVTNTVGAGKTFYRLSYP